MKLKKDTLKQFDSIYDAAAHVCLLYAAKRILDFVGQPLAHTFTYKRESDLSRVKTSDNIARMTAVYSRVELEVLREHPAFDPAEDILLMVICEDAKRTHGVLFPIEIARHAAECTPCEVAICPSQSGDGLGCAACGKDGAVKKCSGCKVVRYCCEDCQRANWSVHKESCKKVQNALKKKE